jgi:two-component system LytT family response regulator
MSHSAPDDEMALADATPAALRVVIVDDEPLARDCMRLALRGAPDVRVVAECKDGPSAVEAIRAHAPDLVFLDVQMPGLDGFGVIERVGPEAMPPVVFVTAYDAHAIRAFEVHALDYVLKPFGDQRLVAALDRARSAIRERRHGELGRRLAEVVRGWYQLSPSGAPPLAAASEGGAGSAPSDDDDAAAGSLDAQRDRRATRSSYLTRFAVREDGRVRFVAAADVDWIEADGNYIVLHVGEARHRVRASLRRVAEELDPKLFARIHRSAVVNIDRIREVQPWFGGDYIAILRGGAKLRVSRLRAAQLLRPTA